MNETPELQRRLGLFDATMLVIGSMIGSGIFLTLAIMAQSVPSPGLLLALWVFAGLFTMLAAICYAELATMYPHTGGQYIYLREAYGPFWAFLFGWTQFLVIQTGYLAIVAIAFAKYLGALCPSLGEKTLLFEVPFGALLPLSVQTRLPDALVYYRLSSAQVAACVVIALLTGINMRGVREGAFVQNVFTVTKMAALAALPAAGLMYLTPCRGGLAHFTPLWPDAEVFKTGFPAVAGLLPMGFYAALAVAMSKALFSFDGWAAVTYVSGEIHDSPRIMPRALVLGCFIVTIMYLLANVAYMAVLPIDRIAGAKEDRVAQSAAQAMFGDHGTLLVSIAIMIATFGAINGLVLVGARLFYAMARAGLFFRRCASLSSRGTPTAALAVQGAWAMVLALTGSYSELLTYCMFASVLFSGLTAAAVYWLRVTQPDRPRPYRCWGYPLTPALYLFICALFLIYVVQGNAIASLAGCGLILTGIPFYWAWKTKRAYDS